MVFSSSIFLLYFLPAFLLLYYLSPRVAKNYVALAASLFFYAWGAPDFIFIVIASIVFDFYLVKWMHKTKGRKKKVLVGISVVSNIGLLLYFKYANFFVENFNWLLEQLGSSPVAWTNIALPIGISFFIFQKMTYGVDVYRGTHNPLEKLSDLGLYILMFPQLIAGPIIRFNEIADQLVDRRAHETIDNRLTGFFRFAIGLARKVLIANPLGEFADGVFAIDVSSLSSGTLWIGILAYTFQIYNDFAGYSDMAIGLGKMIGFRFPENFNSPYISTSISEFWRRWHMSLGRWMRDYIYIPLGGNRVSTGRMYFNLWLVFLISGFWHGAAWTFVAWGAYHGLFLIADRIFLLKFYKAIGKLPSMLITFLIVIIGWIMFRAENIGQFWDYVTTMFSFKSGETLFVNNQVWTLLIVAFFLGCFAYFPKAENWQTRVYADKQKFGTFISMTLIAIVLFIFSLAAITSSGFNPFIYFRF